MSIKIDLTGKKFGKLKVVKEGERSRAGRIRWICRCECGKETLVQTGCLKEGTTKSCGCLKRYHPKKNNNLNVINELTQERVKELFDYKEDGSLIWKVKNSNRININSVAGCICNDNYFRTRIDGRLYKNCRVVWLWHNGKNPDGFIDHINNIRNDDRIENLRLTSKSGNAQNFGNRNNNLSGVKGVCWDKSKASWMVRINTKFISRFKNFDEAVLCRLAVEQCLDWLGHDNISPAYQYAVKNKLIKE